MRLVGLLATFFVAWFALDRLAVSPPMPGPALLALGIALLVLAAGEILAFGARPGAVLGRLGYGRPDGRTIAIAMVAGVLVLVSYLVGASLLGVRLELRPAWPLVLLGALIFHGLAEESVWRAFVFRHLREGRSFRAAVALSIPLIALTHAAIIAGSGWLVGGLAMVTAAVTCLPLAYLWDRRGGVWAPAIVHGMIGTWQVFERTYPVTFSVVVMTVSILVPLVVFPIGRRVFGRSQAVPAAGAVPSAAS